jgi:hypothetical protein
MIKIIPGAVFVVATSMCAVPGYCAGECDPNINCRGGVARAAPSGHIETVNVAAGTLLRRIVNDSAVRNTKAPR